MTMVLLLALIALLFTVGAVHAAADYRKEQSLLSSIENIKKFSISHMYTSEDIRRIKEYASLFGVDASTGDVSNIDLLDMGNKLESVLGEHKVKNIVRRVTSGETYVPTVVSKESMKVSHIVTRFISICSLIAVPSSYVVIKSNVKGGDRGEEGTITIL